MENNEHYCIGLDFGTDSVRAILVNIKNGSLIGTEVCDFPRWKKQEFCNATENIFRQHPADHLESMEQVVRSLMEQTAIPPESVRGICVDATGSSPLPVDRHGKALALSSSFADNPNAMMILWKDHSAIAEAEEINQLARDWEGVDVTRFSGGIYSAEWFWSKILHMIRDDEQVRQEAWSWMEHCDYMTYVLTGEKDLRNFKRSRCAAGHKAMWHKSWAGLPPEDFLSQLDPYLARLRDRLYTNTYVSTEPAGNLCPEWAKKFGLTTGVTIAVGTLDAHAGAVGAGIRESALVRVMGTSTCDMIVTSRPEVKEHCVRGICGQVDGSIIPGLTGMEAGQSAFGDLLAWFKTIILQPVRQLIADDRDMEPVQKEKLISRLDDQLLQQLTEEASRLPLKHQTPVALDWINGRRTPDANPGLTASVYGLSLGTNAAVLFRALVESICFGSRKIVDRFRQEGVPIHSVIGIGGVADKSSFVMQTLANVLDMPISVSASGQAPALGAAMYASVASGYHVTLEDAIAAMSTGTKKVYHPQPEAVAFYKNQYARYEALADNSEDLQSSSAHHPTLRAISPH